MVCFISPVQRHRTAGAPPVTPSVLTTECCWVPLFPAVSLFFQGIFHFLHSTLNYYYYSANHVSFFAQQMIRACPPYYHMMHCIHF